VASGPKIRANAALNDLSIVDVAPFVLHSLDLPIPSDMTGRVPVEAFESDALRRRPPRLVAVEQRTPGPERAAPVAVLSAEEEATMVRRLQTLGYME
jgi:hypothetical protein